MPKNKSLNAVFKITIDNDPYSASNSNLIDESNENNNTFTKTIVVGEATTTSKQDLVITSVEEQIATQTINGIAYNAINFFVKYRLNNSNTDLNKNFYFGVETNSTNEYKNGFKANSNIDYLNSSTLTKANQEYSVLLGVGYLLPKGKSLNTIFKITIDHDPYSASNSNLIDESNENNNTFTKTIVVGEASATIQPDLIISNIEVPTSLIRPTTANVTWKTNFPSNSNVHYWSVDKTHENWNWDKIDDYTQTTHVIVLKDLKPFTTYYFTVTSTKEGGNNNTSEQMSFTTTTVASSPTLGNGVTDANLEKINNTAKNLNENKFDQILGELKVLKDIIKEQQSQIKYLAKLTQGVKNLSEAVSSAINNFITYGVDDNTKKLGAGERAAVMYSYKVAFDKLPETENELADAIKIANGRWPSITNDEAEKKAKEQFQKIYKRIPDMDNAKDNAAVTVMAYGLRQRAENRNLESEKAGINIFKGIYKKLPETTEEWNTMQAITYSGAAREKDTDGDLLPDEREAELGTDKNKKDTDGDGYADGAEVLNGFDPLKK